MEDDGLKTENAGIESLKSSGNMSIIGSITLLTMSLPN
jgi:hypothetical protein